MEISGSSARQTRNRDHISIDIRHGDHLVASIRRKMETISCSHSICRVRENIRSTNEKAYIPDKVSIGPYHHGKQGLENMEEHKWRYIHALLSRKPNLEASLDDCLAALKEVEHKARACYEQEINVTDDEFLQMMLVDGCFIIELFLKYSIKSLRRRNDPVFTIPGMLFDLRSDLMLLENQIPLFILQRLFEVVPTPTECTQSFAKLAFHFFKYMIPGDPQIHQQKFSQEGNHLLDLICHCLLPTHPGVKGTNPDQKHFRCATGLQAAGIRIKGSRTKNLLDIKFARGVLEIPHVIIHQYTESLFRNLIALEHSSCDGVQHITSYVFLMKSLVGSDKDVKLLQKKDILTNYDVTEKEVATLFEKLCEGVDLNESCYGGIYDDKNVRVPKTGWIISTL
ncbi:PROTEIN putative (DUF247)-RELATED-RELATED [Salix viminalis]|uniref:PROTEIN putative (DUF247)-RELATED-RELATED n=1 Tax=Salix viminalis TaxID=40686 RepID=A0A9Q0Z4C1_SALVM|nr:PROTEIN putative (DUF247)-RELATED-RELATED [Salix viminalis]